MLIMDINRNIFQNSSGLPIASESVYTLTVLTHTQLFN